MMRKTVASILGNRGSLSSSIADFHYRPQQVEMGNQVEQAIMGKKTVFIEAGTGIGKTYAYLVPLLLRLAADNKTKAFVSTYTRHLQDQLFNKDIPRLMEAMDIDVAVAILKGRRNYICSWRLNALLHRGQINPSEAWALLKILVWLESGGSGDLEQINFSHQGLHILPLIHADHPICRENCSVASGCPYQLAVAVASAAQLVVINHALLLHMGQIGLGREKMKMCAIIIDEAHHLEEAARASAMIDFTPARVAAVIADICQGKLLAEGNTLLDAWRQWLVVAGSIVAKKSQHRRLLLSQAARGSSEWLSLAEKGHDWLASFKLLLGRSLGHIDEGSMGQAQELIIEFEQFLKGNSERIQWIEYEPTWKYARLQDTALSATLYMEGIKQLSPAIMLTSATLTVAGSFAYIKDILGLSSASEVLIRSPYMQRDQMLIIIVDDGPEPQDEQFDSFSADISKLIGSLLSGRLLVLLTSHHSLKMMYGKLVRNFQKSRIRLLAQDMTGGRSNMASRFRDIHHSVLLGTNSFWEGIDVPGESLSGLLIPKLPFPAIDDPVLTILSERVGKKFAFEQVIMPRMLLRLRQGIGRLIRSESDRGVVVILDPRISRRSYGREVLQSLPTATVQFGSRHTLAVDITSWFGEKKLVQWKTLLDQS